MGFDGRWAPYVSVAQRRANANLEASKLAKKGQTLRPIHIKTRTIAKSFWGLAWCKNLEVYSDWANRMPRGRTYARNGSIIDLQIETGVISSMVSGSSLYEIKIKIDTLDAKKWKTIREDCSQQVGSLLDLMRGKLPDAVLTRLTDLKHGIFPSPKELKLQCSCPDYARMCKHIAATLYGVGYLLDTEPELFFKMRGVDQAELVSDAMSTQSMTDAIGLDEQSDFAGEDLGAIFGIDLANTTDASPANVKAVATRNQKKTALPKTNRASSKTAAVAKPAKKVERKTETKTAKKPVRGKTKSKG